MSRNSQTKSSTKNSRISSPQLSPRERELALEIRKRKQDALINFVPTPTQKEFLESEARWKSVTGGNRCGKSAVAACAGADILRKTGLWHEPSPYPLHGLLLVPARRQSYSVWGKKLLENSELPGLESPLIPAREIEKASVAFMQGEKTFSHLQMKNGNELTLAWSNAPNMWERLQGIAFDFVIIDENAGDEKLMAEISQRLLDAQSKGWKHGGMILWPGSETSFNIGHELFLRACRDPEIPYASEFRLKPAENPAINMEHRDQTKHLMTEEEEKIRILGTGSRAGVVSIYAPYLQMNPNIIVDGDYVHGEYDNIVIAYDPGWVHPCGILFASLRPDDHMTLHLWHFICEVKRTHEMHAKSIAEALHGRFLRCLVPDPAAKTDRSGTGIKIIEHIKEAHRNNGVRYHRDKQKVIWPKNRHEHGIGLVRSALENDKIRIYKNGPGMQRFISQMKLYRGKEESRFTGPGGVVKKDDEGPDCLRYLTVLQLRWMDLGKNSSGVEDIRLTELDSITAQMRMSADIWKSEEKKRRKRRLRKR